MRKLLHCNWGWDGDCNGYFYSGAFDTQSPEKYDGNYNRTNFDAKYNVEILPYVHP